MENQFKKTINDIWSYDQISICTEYALGNNKKVLEMLDNNMHAYSFVNSLMCDKHSNSLLRERIIARIEGFEHSNNMLNYDAYDKINNKLVEEKNEQHSSLDPRMHQVTGGAGFGIEGLSSVQKYITDNPLICLGGWIDGRLVYTVSFNFNDSTIANNLSKQITKRLDEKVKTKPKFYRTDWNNASSLKLRYFNETYFELLKPYISKNLIKTINSIRI